MNVARGKTTQPFITRVGGDDTNADANMNKKSEVILSLNQYIPALSLSTFLLTAFSYNFNIEQFTTSTFVQVLTHSFTHSLTHSLTYLLTHSFRI